MCIICTKRKEVRPPQQNKHHHGISGIDNTGAAYGEDRASAFVGGGGRAT